MVLVVVMGLVVMMVMVMKMVMVVMNSLSYGCVETLIMMLYTFDPAIPVGLSFLAGPGPSYRTILVPPVLSARSCTFVWRRSRLYHRPSSAASTKQNFLQYMI